MEEDKQENPKPRTSDKTYWVKFVSIVLVVIAWIGFIVWRDANPDLSLRIPLFIAIMVSIGGIIAYIGYSRFESRKTSDEIPPAKSEKEIKEKLKEYFEENYWHHIRKNNGIILINDKTVNKNRIQAYKILFADTNLIRIGIINANYLDRGITDLSGDTSEYYIEKRMNVKSESPHQEPDEEFSEETIDNFGKPIRKTRRKTHKEIQKKQEDSAV